MTAKEKLHQAIETLNEEEAEAAANALVNLGETEDRVRPILVGLGDLNASEKRSGHLSKPVPKEFPPGYIENLAKGEWRQEKTTEELIAEVRANRDAPNERERRLDAEFESLWPSS